MDRELLEFNDEFGSELKKSFEKEFDVNDISVSDDLIARTMAAIRLSGDDPEQAGDKASGSKPAARSMDFGTIDKENREDKAVDNVTDISRAPRRSMIIKWVSGIAAALFLGVVVFFVIKIGIGGYSKKESSADMAVAPNSVQYDNASAVCEEDSYEDSIAEPEASSVEAEMKKIDESVAKGSEERSEKASDESYSFSDDYNMGSQLDSKYSMGGANGKNSLRNDTLKSDDVSDGIQTIGFSATESMDEEKENVKKDSSDDDENVTTDNNVNYESIPAEKIDNNGITEKTGMDDGKTSVDEQDGDDRYTGYTLSEEVGALLDQFIISLDDDVKESLSDRAAFTAEAREMLAEKLRSTEWYGLLVANKDDTLAPLTELYENEEDETKKLLMEILLECVNKDVD